MKRDDRRFTTSRINSGVTHAWVWKNWSQTVLGTFPAPYFLCKSFFFFFFLWWLLMLRPYAGSFWAHNRAQCADRPPAACPPQSHQLPLLKGHKLGSVRAADCTGELGSTQTPTHCSAQDTFRSHPPHTALLCAPKLPHQPKGRKFCSPTVWSLMSWMWLPHLLYHLPINCNQEAKREIQSLLIIILLL